MALVILVVGCAAPSPQEAVDCAASSDPAVRNSERCYRVCYLDPDPADDGPATQIIKPPVCVFVGVHAGAAYLQQEHERATRVPIVIGPDGLLQIPGVGVVQVPADLS